MTLDSTQRRVATQPDGTGGKASFNDFSFVHKVDKASPVLFTS